MDNNSFLINTIATTVILWGAVTLVIVPQIDIFAPSDKKVDTHIETTVEDTHNIAPTVDTDKVLDIINTHSVLGNDVPQPQETTNEKEPEKRVKQPGTFYRCTNPITWRPIEHGKSITVYEKSIVTWPEQCKQETRVCDNGTMLWSYIETSCQQVWDWCVWPDGKNYVHGWVGTYYLHNEVIWKPEDGEDICTRQARVCQNGSRYLFDRQTKSNFDYKYSYCNAKIQ